jgi:guanine deaminase
VDKIFKEKPMPHQAFLGTAFHAPAPDRLEVLQDALIVVGDDGAIDAIRPADEAEPFRAAGRLTALEPGQILLPGLIDLHVHAPQWPQLGKALDVPLEDWLQKYTFPLEARYADLAYAAPVYESLVAGLLANGTTTALYFATIHLPATKRLAEICLRRGQRALIGLVAMDDPEQCPDDYRAASAEQAAADTRALIDHIRALPGNESGLVRPAITPRFIPSCTDDLLHRLGALARETGCHVQTHCSESDWEHGFVLERCGVTDAAALAGFGLLSRRTILAHGNFLTDNDLELIRQAGAGIAHCPLSNIYFANAVFPLRHAMRRGAHVGLGTDIAGGPSASMFDSARMAVAASRSLEGGVDGRSPPDRRGRPGSRIGAIEAFWLATAGGGIALDLPIGLFRAGYQFDAIVIDANRAASDLRVYPGDSPEDLLQKIIYNAGKADIVQAWVAASRANAPDSSA